MKKTQMDKIVDYIIANGSITRYEAAYHIGVLELSARIVGLKKLGYIIEAMPEKYKAQDGSFHPCKRYFIRGITDTAYISKTSA